MRITLLAVEYASSYLSLVLFRVEHTHYLLTRDKKLNKHFKIVIAIGGLLSADEHNIDAFEGHLLKVTLPPFGLRWASALDVLFIGSLIERRQDRRLSDELEVELEVGIAPQPITQQPIKLKLTYAGQGDSILQSQGTCAACMAGICEIEYSHT